MRKDQEKKMNKKRKAMMRGMAVAVCAFLMSVCFGGLTAFADMKTQAMSIKSEQIPPVTQLSKAYYQAHKTTAAALEKRMGKPLAVKWVDNGQEVWSYKEDNTKQLDFSFFVIQNGYVVGSNVSESIL